MRAGLANPDPPTKTVAIDKNAPLAESVQKAVQIIKTVYRCGPAQAELSWPQRALCADATTVQACALSSATRLAASCPIMTASCRWPCRKAWTLCPPSAPLRLVRRQGRSAADRARVVTASYGGPNDTPAAVARTQVFR